MLIQFAVENYLSFNDKAVLNMVAAGGAGDGARNSVTVAGMSLLRCAAIYGANAAGKSNLVKAMNFARRLILEGTKAGEPIAVATFRPDPSASQRPSRFEFELLIDGTQYAYGFLLTAQLIASEWLMAARDGKEEVLFQRDAAKIEIGEAWSRDVERRQFLDFVAKGTRPNQLFLTEAVDRNVSEVLPVMRWFRDSCTTIFPTERFRGLVHRAMQDRSLVQFLGSVLEKAGTGISELALDMTPIADPPAREPEELERIFRVFETSSDEQIYVRHMNGEGSVTRVQLTPRHRTPGGQTIDYNFSEESDGTRRLLHLAPLLYSVTHGPVAGQPLLIVDELERSLHPLLTRFFIESFLAAPAGQAQLIFTTHDTNLLDLNLLSPEGIWFAEKDPAGASNLYSLSEFKREQLEQLGPSLEKGYLAGRFGAIPFFGDARKLGWIPNGEPHAD